MGLGSVTRATTGHALWNALDKGFLTADDPQLSILLTSLRGQFQVTILLVIKTGTTALVMERS